MRESKIVERLIRILFRGGPAYYAWLVFLLVLSAQGIAAYVTQAQEGLVVTSMRDSVSWGSTSGISPSSWGWRRRR